MLEKYSIRPNANLLTKPPTEPEDVDVAIALDTAIQNRLGTAFPAVRSAKLWINIDHHPSNPGYGHLVYIDPAAPATGQILYELMKDQNLPIDREIAENLMSRSRPIPALFNTRIRARAHSRSWPSSSDTVSMWGGSAG